MPILELDQLRIAVVGLGYVGLPLAVEFGKSRSVIGFDINSSRVEALSRGEDHTLEVDAAELQGAMYLSYSSNPEALAGCNVYIVTVPTPIDSHKRPDLTPLLSASRSIGAVLKRGDIVIYESTVYPGCTEEDCVPILEQMSGLKFNVDFFAGYSPERINPGDKLHRLPSIRKVTSGSTPAVADLVDRLYASIITAGTHRAPSIRVAEAAKVIENTQRDLNIALVNELAILFNRLGIDTRAVLEAAGTKWNFLPFKPGLVGGHCIGVDPYYLTHKAQAVGFHPEVILAGRKVNDGMGGYIAAQVIKTMSRKGISVHGARALVLGLAFKENCPDLRNTRVLDIVRELAEFQVVVDVHDPYVSADEAKREYALDLTAEPAKGSYDVIILAVAHKAFAEMDISQIRSWARAEHVVCDVKGMLPGTQADWTL